MRNIARIVTALVVVLLGALVLFFVLENQQVISLTMFGRSLPGLPISVLVIATMVAGMVLGALPGVYGTYRLRRKLRSR